MQYERFKLKYPLKCVVVRVWEKHRWVNIVNFYNPILKISIRDLEEVMEHIGTPVIWV